MSDKELRILHIKEKISVPDTRDPGHYPDVFRGRENCESKRECSNYAMSHSWGCNLYNLSLDLDMKE